MQAPIHYISDLDLVLRLLTAVLCGGAIGLEREQRNLPTGFRTLGLVGLGSCIAVIAAIKAGDSDGFSRVAQGIITGIGFLGGGVILQKGTLQEVKGLTTAAAIWTTAAIGLMCGLGELKVAIIATVLAIAMLMFESLTQKVFGRPNADKKSRDDD